MYPVTDKFKAALRTNHTVTARADFYRQGTWVSTVPILSGQVQEDKSATVRRRATLAFSPASQELILPTQDNFTVSPLWPIGHEVHVWSGIRFDDGTLEEVPLGVFRLSKPQLVNSGSDFQIQVDAYDNSRTVSRNKFTDVYSIVAGTDFATAIKKLIQNRMPTLADSDFLFMKTDGTDGGSFYTTPTLIFVAEDDPWEKALEMAKSVGAELFFDGAGKCVLRAEPDPLYTPSVFDYVAGVEATFDSLTRTLDDETAYNGVQVVGQNNDNVTLVPRGVAWDVNPASPTYYDPARPGASLYGPVPTFVKSDYVTSDLQGKGMAEGMLLSVIGILESVEFTGIANPAHEGSDVIRAYDPKTGVDGNYLLDSLSLGLGETPGMSGTTRKRRVS